MRASQERLGRAATASVRVVAVIALVTATFMAVFVVTDALGRVGVEQALEEPGSAEARAGADHPAETVHVPGAVVAAVLIASGLLGLALRPERAGSAYHAGAVAVGMLTTAVLAGNPDNHGGQAGLVDPLFVVVACPPLLAALLARPWRARRGIRRPGLPHLALAGLSLPGLWYGAAQGFKQRNTWPPLSDPHHQAHWYIMATLAIAGVMVFATSLARHRGWGVSALVPAVGAVVLGGASLIDPDAASALPFTWAVYALLWGGGAVAVTAVEAKKDAGHTVSNLGSRAGGGPASGST